VTDEADPHNINEAVLAAARELLADVRAKNDVQQVKDRARGASPDSRLSVRDVVDSEQIAKRLALDRLEIEQALKHLVETDCLTATFFTGKPAEVTEVSSD
jgi:hypothetical protein